MSLARITCPACARILEVDAEAVGQEVECGACLHVFVAKVDAQTTPATPVCNAESTEKPWHKPPEGKRKGVNDGLKYDDDDHDPDLSRGRMGRPNQRSRVSYILLGLFLGNWGAHNFYAGRNGAAIAQLLISAISIPLCCVVVGFFTFLIPTIWAIIDILVIERDGDGVPMVS
jgi:TM2 domain-containing membrane protein YozV